MTTEDIVKVCKTGDVLMVKGHWAVRMLTGESVSHVAIVLKKPIGIYVAEYLTSGFKLSLIGNWFKFNKERRVWHGQAPNVVVENPVAVLKGARLYGHQSYDWLEYFDIWASYCLGKSFLSDGMVCSTYVQHCWEEAGWGTRGLLKPSSFQYLCSNVQLVQ